MQQKRLLGLRRGSAYRLCLLVLANLLGSVLPANAQSRLDAVDFKQLDRTHNVTAPAWGPYTKRYMGISHIADARKGLRFDLAVMPGFFGQKVLVPNVLYESGYYPWQSSADQE